MHIALWNIQINKNIFKMAAIFLIFLIVLLHFSLKLTEFVILFRIGQKSNNNYNVSVIIFSQYLILKYK